METLAKRKRKRKPKCNAVFSSYILFNCIEKPLKTVGELLVKLQQKKNRKRIQLNYRVLIELEKKKIVSGLYNLPLLTPVTLSLSTFIE